MTVDVTGVWVGSSSKGGGAYSSGGSVQLTLQQSGPKVTGQFRPPEGGSLDLEGSVNGDKFSFRIPARSITGAVEVSGDEMIGSISTTTVGIMSLHVRRQP